MVSSFGSNLHFLLLAAESKPAMSSSTAEMEEKLREAACFGDLEGLLTLVNQVLLSHFLGLFVCGNRYVSGRGGEQPAQG